VAVDLYAAISSEYDIVYVEINEKRL